MRTLTLLLLLSVTTASAEEATSRTVVYLLDPRILTHTEHTLSTEYGKGKTDVMAMRTLTASEARALDELLRRELADDDNVPFCGHQPAYAVRKIRPDGTAATVTLCGLCGTWARDGKLRGLKGKQALAHLEQLLPLPDFLKPVKQAPDLDALGSEPFYTLEAEGNGAP